MSSYWTDLPSAKEVRQLSLSWVKWILARDHGAIATTCGCGITYTLAAFRRLGRPIFTRVPAGSDGEVEPAYTLESRQCVCRSHCSVEVMS